MRVKGTVLDSNCRRAVVAALSNYYVPVVQRVKGSSVFSFILNSKGLMGYSALKSSSTDCVGLRGIKSILTELCDGASSDDRYKYYLKVMFSEYGDILVDNLVSWKFLSSLIGVCIVALDGGYATIVGNIHRDDLIAIRRLANYITALFMIRQGIDGYDKIITGCIGSGDLDIMLTDIFNEKWGYVK